MGSKRGGPHCGHFLDDAFTRVCPWVQHHGLDLRFDALDEKPCAQLRTRAAHSKPVEIIHEQAGNKLFHILKQRQALGSSGCLCVDEAVHRGMRIVQCDACPDYAGQGFRQTMRLLTRDRIPLMMLVIYASFRAWSGPPGTPWRFWATAFQWQFAFNAAFHLSLAAIDREYVPGMVMAASVSLPATAAVAIGVKRFTLISGWQQIGAIFAGGVIAALAIGALFI